MRSAVINKVASLILVVALVTVLGGGAGVAAAQAGGTLEISLREYIEAYVANSDDVSAAQESADDAVTAWQRAVEEKQARLTVEELKNTADTRQLALRETTNNTVISAVQAYASLGQTERDLAAKRVSLNVASEKLRVARLRYSAGLTTEDSVMEQESSNLSAQDALVKAENSFKQARESFCENIGVAVADKIVLKTDVSGLYKGAGDHDRAAILEAARKASSAHFSAAAAEDIARRKYEALNDPMIATQTEMKSAQKTYEDAKAKLADAEKSIVTSVDDALASLASLKRSLDMAAIDAELATKNLDVAKIKFNHGEMLQYELDSQVSSTSQSQYKAAQAKVDVLVQILKIHVLTGGDAMSLLGK